MTDMHNRERSAEFDLHNREQPAAAYKIGRHISLTMAVISLATVFGAAVALVIRILNGR